MIRIRDLSLPPDGDMARLVQAAARQLRISPNEIKQLDLKKKSVDARKKNDVRIIYTVDVAVKGREDKILKMAHSPKASIARDMLYSVPQPQALPDSQPIIVGFGPAGMFAALLLAQCGQEPIVLERGQAVEERERAVQRFWKAGRTRKRGTRPCRASGRPGSLTRSATCSSARAARARFQTES